MEGKKVHKRKVYTVIYTMEIGKGIKVIRWRRRRRCNEKVLYARWSLLEFRFWCWHKLLEFFSLFLFFIAQTLCAPHIVCVIFNTHRLCLQVLIDASMLCLHALVHQAHQCTHIQIYWAWYWELGVCKTLCMQVLMNKRRVCVLQVGIKKNMNEENGRENTHSLSLARFHGISCNENLKFEFSFNVLRFLLRCRIRESFVYGKRERARVHIFLPLFA